MKLTDLGINLSNEEHLIGEYSFCYSILLFFIKCNVYVTNKRFIANVPNVVLAILPLGKNVSTFPLRNIASIRNQTKFKLLLMFFAGILLITGIGNLTSIYGLFSLAIGIIIGILSLPTLIQVQSSGSTNFTASFAFWEKTKALQLINKVNETIAEL